MLLPNKTVTVTNAGGTETISVYQIPDVVFLEADGGSVTLAAPFRLDYSALPPSGSVFSVIVDSGIDLNGQGLTIYGNSYTTTMQNSGKQWVFNFKVVELAIPTLICQISPLNLADSGSISGAALVDETVTLSKLEDLTSAEIIVGDGTNRPAAVAVTGDIGITNAGVTSITAGAIVNADVNASAAIDRSKLANGTADHVVINSGAGAFSSEAQLAESRGGTGLDTSASTGFATVSAGTWSVGAISETLRADVSFESGWQGTYYVRVPYACTVTAAKARVTKAIAGTDDATVTLKDNSGTTMASGTLTLTASSAHGTGFTCTPSANNTLTANQEIQLLVAKTTAGGACSVDITITRTA